MIDEPFDSACESCFNEHKEHGAEAWCGDCPLYQEVMRNKYGDDYESIKES